jgi:hypothetical protein
MEILYFYELSTWFFVKHMFVLFVFKLKKCSKLSYKHVEKNSWMNDYVLF